MCRCVKMLADYVAWCEQEERTHWVGFVMVTNHPNPDTHSPGEATYTNDILVLNASKTAFVGNGSQYFSDRLGENDAPFNPNQTDQLTLQIDIMTAQVTVTLLSQGNRSLTGEFRCANGMLYGFFDDGTAAVISLSEHSA